MFGYCCPNPCCGFGGVGIVWVIIVIFILFFLFRPVRRGVV